MSIRSRISGLARARNTTIALITLALLVGLLLGLNNLMRPPSNADAAEVVYGQILHYEEVHGEPHVVFKDRDHIYFDHLRRDYKYMLSRQSPGWVLTGLWYFIPVTNEPASVGVARCTGILGEGCDKSTELFGQINSAEITTLEVEYDEEWHRFSVEAPSYAVQLNGFTGVPTNYRWLNTDGNMIYHEGPVQPLQPGR